ncbi:replication initiation protein RepM [Conchiformibius steedae]|uniref:replication initiation protein RepM n=1 Tax=Conchiformibius steedae TaxID=153493 RepID=UPI0015F6EEA1|nr:replication initiation protein RepM [Conchiformibius steedae]QMT32573.1 replication initiation protein [Conchiformibius steedae]
MGNLIVKDNALIEASHKLNEVEQRIILLAILKAREVSDTVEELKGKNLTIHASDYISHFRVDKSTAYRVLKKTVVSLFRAEWGYKFINNKGQSQVAYRRFIQSADYIENGASIQFKFSDDIIPFLVELEKRFTTYEVKQVSKLSSGYAMRLYEFFMQHLDKKAGKGWLEISLDDLRFRFGLLPTEYKGMSDFKRYVLNFSLKQINERTDLTATYEQRKQGRVITGFRFEFIKNQPKPKKTKTAPQPDWFAEFSEEERTAIQERIADHIARLEASGEIVSDFHRQNITQKAVAERWGLDVLEQKKKKKQKDDKKKASEQAWQNIPDGTRFRSTKDGSIWRKDVGSLVDEYNRFVPEFMIVDFLQYLEEI